MTQDQGGAPGHGTGEQPVPQASAPYGQPPYAPTPYPPTRYGQPLPHGQAAYWQPPHGYPPVLVRPTNGFAVASTVLGIIWIYWIGSVLALVFGYVAKKQIRERGEGGGGMATAGIVLGWVGIGILVLVVVLGFAAATFPTSP